MTMRSRMATMARRVRIHSWRWRSDETLQAAYSVGGDGGIRCTPGLVSVQSVWHWCPHQCRLQLHAFRPTALVRAPVPHNRASLNPDLGVDKGKTLGKLWAFREMLRWLVTLAAGGGFPC